MTEFADCARKLLQPPVGSSGSAARTERGIRRAYSASQKMAAQTLVMTAAYLTPLEDGLVNVSVNPVDGQEDPDYVAASPFRRTLQLPARSRRDLADDW